MPLTRIDREELAYNTYAGGHSRSNRKGRVRYPDGIIRSVTLGVPDTYFSIPAHGRMKGAYVTGSVTVGNDGEYEFYIYNLCNCSEGDGYWTSSSSLKCGNCGHLRPRMETVNGQAD